MDLDSVLFLSEGAEAAAVLNGEKESGRRAERRGRGDISEMSVEKMGSQLESRETNKD